MIATARYDGKTLSNKKASPNIPDSAPAEQFRASNCSVANQGNCTSVPAGTGIKVGCTTSPGERPAESTITNQELQNETDPALRAAGCSKKKCGLIANYINPIILLLSALVAMAVVIGIVVGAIQIMASTGDPQKHAKGKKHIQDALIGLVGYVLLFAFLQFLIPGGVLQ